MRLINADAFLERTRKDPLFPLLERYGLSGVIEAEPTVEAIPIVWIEEYISENPLYQSDDFNIYIQEMISDWITGETE